MLLLDITTQRKLTKVFQQAPIIPMTPTSRFVIMSDCHRGDGSWSDNFLKNQNLFFAALTYYYEENFTYIELGDGDELWENRKIEPIIQVHSDAFWIMSQFYQQNRLYLLYGNHDMIKKNQNYICKNCHSYYYDGNRKYIPLFPDIIYHESLILEDCSTKNRFYLTHGHQGDLLNDTLWPLSRFLVRYIWKPLELIGILDPTNTATNYKKQGTIEKRLIHWAKKEGHVLIAGHTHRPSFPQPHTVPYFNDGSCVHPRCITAIEIYQETICLVKWCVKTRENRTLYVGRQVLEGPVSIHAFF